MLVLDREREVAVPGTAGPGGHECVPGFCQVQHYFANVYVCRSTGCHHVCDRTCRYRQGAPGGTVCRLSGRHFAWEDCSVLGKSHARIPNESCARGSKRSRDDLEDVHMDLACH